jgi:SAM-dependent methyltransferase
MGTETVPTPSTPPSAGQAQIRERVRAMWAGVAGAWGEHAEYADERGAAITEMLLDRTGLRPGDRVLELACGPGGGGLAAATRVAPGEVVLSDIAEEMTAIAAARAAARGITNVRTLVLDLDDIDQPDSSYDAVICREGLMFAIDPARAVRDVRRVLKTDGRVGVAVWGERARNPWLGVVLDAVSDQLGMPMPPPGIPGPFALDDTDRLRGIFAAAGLVDIEITEHDTPLRAGSFDEWWNRTSSLAGPLAAIVAALPAEAHETLRARLERAVEPYRTPDGLELPGVSVIGTAGRSG